MDQNNPVYDKMFDILFFSVSNSLDIFKTIDFQSVHTGKEAYISLFNKVSEAIEILQSGQLQCETIFVNESDGTDVIDINNSDARCNIDIKKKSALVEEVDKSTISRLYDMIGGRQENE